MHFNSLSNNLRGTYRGAKFPPCLAQYLFIHVLEHGWLDLGFSNLQGEEQSVSVGAIWPGNEMKWEGGRTEQLWVEQPYSWFPGRSVSGLSWLTEEGLLYR